MKFAHQVPAVLAAVVAVSVLPGGRLYVGAQQTSTVNTGFAPVQGNAANCTADPSVCASNSKCEADYGGDGVDYCICNDGFTGDGLNATGTNNTGCNDIKECDDPNLNDCIAVSAANAVFTGSPADTTVCEERDGSYVCNCPDGTVGASTNSNTTDAAGGDGKTLFSGGSGCPAAISAGSTAGGYDDEADCLADCISPDGACFYNYLGATTNKTYCACKDGFKGDATLQPESPDGCTRLAPVLGENQTLGTASQKIDDAIGILDTYLKAKAVYEEKQCQLVETTDACTAATALYNETWEEFKFANFTYEQAVDYTAQKLADLTTAQALDGTAAERTRLEKAAQDAYEAANATEYEALAAKNTANTTQGEAEDAMNDVCDTNKACPEPGNVNVCVGKADDEKTTAEGIYNTTKDAAEGNNLIPEILTPDTANPYQDPFDEFVYGDSDGDLIPDKFDACPTQMGLRRNRVAMGNKLKTSVGGVGYETNDDVWTNFTDPGPQDFCPSGCPEYDADGTTRLDSDGDGIYDCEDRCPFVYGIRYNHAWTYDDRNNLGSLPRNLDYNGCPDFDEDGIPDIFDQCPGCVWDDENNVCTAVAINDNSVGGECYSGCPNPGINPKTGQPFDTDLDGVPDCFDRCPGTYAPNGNITLTNGLNTTDGCPDLDLDGTPDYLDYCPVNPGSAVFKYTRKLESGTDTGAYNNGVPDRVKHLTILGCPDRDGDLVPDTVDLCDSCAYPNQKDTTPYQASACNRVEKGWLEAANDAVCNSANIDGVVVVDRVGCPLDSDQDGVFDGIDMCDGTIHSANDIHDEYAIVYKASDEGYVSTSTADNGVLGCPKDTDGDGVANGIDQCPDEGGFINEDGCPIDSDGDGVSDCASDVGGTSSVLTTSRVRPTWPFTIGHLNAGADVCHNTTAEPRSETAAANNCCNLAYDNCEGTPKFADVSNDYTPSATDSPVTGSENGMGCPSDADNDGVNDGRDRCPYSTPVEVDYTNGLDPDDKPVDVSGLITKDTFGCIVTLPAAWDINFVDVTTNTTADADTLNGITDADGDANPDLQVLFTTPKLLWDVQESRGVATPPPLENITSGNVSQYTYDSGTANELIKATVFDYTCTKKFDDSTLFTSPTQRLLPTAVVRGVGKFPEETLDGFNDAGDKNIPEGSQPFYVDVELNPDDLVGSEIWKIEPPFDEASIEFCLRVDLYSDNEESVNFMELKTIVKIDMTQGFKVFGTEVKRNEATTEETQVDIQYPLAACQCDSSNVCVDKTNLNDEFVKQDDAMNVCVRFANPASVPAYVRMTDLKMFTCTQGTLSHTPVLDFVRAQDGLTSVDIIDNGSAVGDDDRMIVVSTNLPSAFFGTTASTVDCEGTLVYDFEQNANIGNRRTAEAPIRAIAPPARSDEERKLSETEEKFSVEISLAPTGSESSSMSAGLIAGVSVAGVVGAAAVALIVAKTIPAVRVSKMTGSGARRLSYETDHSISDNSPNHYLDNDKGYVA